MTIFHVSYELCDAPGVVHLIKQAANSLLPRVFADGAEAAAERSEMARAYPQHTYRVVRVAASGALDASGVAVTWQEREAAKFADGSYSPVPWDGEAWFSRSAHYVHLSTVQPGKVAFTADDTKGASDVQTVMAPGRYLNRFWSEVLTPAQIGTWAATVGNGSDDDGFRLAHSPEDIADVYKRGPRSCMSGSSFDSSVHPCSIYGAGDLALAYLVDGDTVTARALVWPDKLRSSRVYGDITRMKVALEARGYVDTYDFDGARLLRIEERGGFVVPYIDRGGVHDDGGEFLTMAQHDGNVGCQNQNGISDDEETFHCEYCEENFASDDYFTYVSSLGYSVCECCIDNFTECECCQRHTSYTTSVVMSVGRWGNNFDEVCEHCLENGDFSFVDSESAYYSSELVTGCDACHDTFVADDCHTSEHDDETRCQSCHDEHNEETWAELVDTFLAELVELLAPIVALRLQRARVGVRRRLALVGGRG